MEALSDQIARIQQQVQQRRESTPACAAHPEFRLGACPTCDVEEQERRLRERKTEVVEASWRACDSRFPVRYQHAMSLHPQVEPWVQAFRSDPAAAPGLLLLGPTGVGKTYQAYAALRAAAVHPVPVSGVGYRCASWDAGTFSDLIARMRPRNDTDTEEQLARLRRCGVLLVDDLAAGKATEWVEEVTYRLINGRYEEMRPTIFTSNLALSELKEAIGDRIASRLAETCTRVLLAGEDRRRAPAAA